MNIAELKAANLARAQTWQLSVRRAMTALLGAGYIVSGFARDERGARYIMSRESLDWQGLAGAADLRQRADVIKPLQLAAQFMNAVGMALIE